MSTYAAPAPEEKGIVWPSAFQEVAYHLLPRELWKRACEQVSLLGAIISAT